MAGFLTRFKQDVLAKRDELRANQLVPVSNAVPAQPQLIEPEILQVLEEPIAATIVRIEMWCARTGKPFVGVAEQHGKALWLVSNEYATEEAGSAWNPGYNYYEIDADPSWRCPWCGVREDRNHDFLRLIWQCGDPACGGPIHCCGNKRGIFRCSCGQRSRRCFNRADIFKIYGYAGLRGPSGRGETCWSHDEGSRSVQYARYRDASTGSLIGRR